MLQAIDRLQVETAGVDEATLAANQRQLEAVLWNLHVLGEALTHVPQGVRDAHPEIPWQQIRGQRNVLVHQYDEIRVDLVLQAVIEICAIRDRLEQLLDESGA
jgi:uncharacterized protein with HEPN domain